MGTMHTNNEEFQPANTHFQVFQIHDKTYEKLPTIFQLHLGWRVGS